MRYATGSKPSADEIENKKRRNCMVQMYFQLIMISNNCVFDSGQPYKDVARDLGGKGKLLNLY